MPVTLIRTVNNIDLQLKDKRSRDILTSFYKYLKSKGVSESYMNNALKVGLKFCRYYDMQKSIDDIKEKQDILNFLDTKVKTQEEDPDKRWITTWNFYLLHIKIFFRWYYNRFSEEEDNREWKTPSFLKIKNKKTKRLSPYIESEIWSKEEFLLIIKYEGNRRNKAALSLMWDMDARNHEVTLLKIKNVRLKERYGEGEIPSDAKTGSGPLLLTCSFPYVRDWLNEHPFRNEPNASLICNLHNGAPVKSEVIWNIMKHLKKESLD